MAKKNFFSGYEELELTKIKPQGWLLNQLRIQADGITSDLPECWDEVSENLRGWEAKEKRGNWDRIIWTVWFRLPTFCRTASFWTRRGFG